MSSQFLNVDRTTKHGPMASRNPEAMRKVMYEMLELKAVADVCAAGGDFAALATLFGFDNATDAESYYNRLSAIAALVGTAEAEPIRQYMNHIG